MFIKGKTKQLIGWAAFSLSLLITCLWAFWGIIENFHEGWYYQSFWQNIGLMIIQYLSPVFIFICLTLISVWNNKIGAFAFLVVGVAISFWVNHLNFFVLVPFFVFASLFWFGEIRNKRKKYMLTVVLPLVILIIFGIEPMLRVSRRLNDKNFGARIINENGVALVWAPRGPGWPDEGVSWYEANRICAHLSEDASKVESTRQNIWRLPTVEEAVRSMYRNGKNCLGKLDKDGNPMYEITPDKETPLWNPNTKIIYWWTKTEADKNYAYMIEYDGEIRKRRKDFSPNYLGFRAVKEIKK